MSPDAIGALWFLRSLGQVERDLIAEFVDRVYAGQQKYGLLTEGKKDWSREAKEEALDTCVYLAMKLRKEQE